MFLKRIHVPDFRVLRDVDITFEPEFSPRIFPLGSLNGGGKSTLLQLIFILLSCSSDPEKHIFIQNMLDRFEIKIDKDEKTLAKLEILYNQRDISINFLCYKYKPIRTKALNNEEIFESSINIDLSVFRDLKKIESEIIDSENYIKRLHNEIKHDDRSKTLQLTKILLSEEENLVKSLNQERDFLLEKVLIAEKSLKKNNIKYICSFNIEDDTEFILACQINELNSDERDDFLKEISKKTFMAAPLTQIFLFLSRANRKLIFQERSNDEKKNYYSQLMSANKQLSNLFTYDHLAVDYIIEFFKAAMDKDFKQAIYTGGEYGNAYKSVLQALNSILGNKKINIDSDLSGVNFKIDKDGETKDLDPEDLSHGELKRLSIYVWLKYKNIQDSIVLMDEVENALHPDWQYKIISDIAEWGSSNQYILATHSYELCQALTPAHVKELEPKLMTKKQIEN